MAWTNLPTDYADAVWSGLRKFVEITNSDDTVSFRDVTAYTNKEKSFFGAKDANQINTAINYLMTSDEILKSYTKNITDGDCNELVGKLIFAYGNNVSNKPDTATNGYLINIPHSIQSTLYNRQYWLNRTNIKIYVRSMENGEWSDWSDLTYGTADISLKEDKSNKIASFIDSNNEAIELNENQYPSATAVKSYVDLSIALQAISTASSYKEADKDRLLILSEIPSGAISLASAYNKGPIFMYTGTSTDTYTKGKIYEVVKSGLTYSISEV